MSILLMNCQNKDYTLTVKNNSREIIYDVKIWFGDWNVTNGIISSGISSSNIGFRYKLMDVMKITWADVNGKLHEQKFNTFDFIPKDYNGGNVRFLYEKNHNFILHYWKNEYDYPKLIK
jgi:hypothetical protein